MSAEFGYCMAIRKTDAVNATHPLGELIQAAQDKNGWSTRDLQRRAENLGLDMKHSNFSRLKNQELISIKGAVIHALAEVLQVSVQRIAQAAMASMGVEVQAERPALEDVVRDSQEFSTRDRQIIQGLVDTIRTLDTTNQEEAADDAPHMNQAGEPPATTEPDSEPSFQGLTDPGLASHLDLVAARMIAAAEAAYGDDLPTSKVALKLPEVARIFESAVKQLAPGEEARGTNRHFMRSSITDRFVRLMKEALDDRDARILGKQQHPDADEFGRIPLPANYYELAASGHPNLGAEEDARARERGEESQETEQDN